MTLNEIAKLAGVSRTTASYIINGKAEQYRISEKTQQKVLEVVNAHNYRPNHAASSLRAGSSQSLGLIIPDLENTSYAKIAKLLELNARTAGYQVIISCSDDDPATEVDVANLLLSRKLDALIVASALPADNEFYKTVQAKGTPVIAIDRALDDEYFASVISEDLEGAYALTNALLDQPISSIGLIGAVADLGVSIEREQGFQAAINNHLKTVNVSLAYGEQFSQQQGALIAQQWIDANCFPEAILATSYTLFEGVLDCLLKHPEVMERTYLATFGDNRLLDFLPNKIQSLPQQFDLIADHALRLALSAIQGDYQQGVEVVPRKVIRR
ncbi:catabolite repressor/activator [Photobacterium angustum]|uniref:Catabolite repressor/activator n=1 Tax=Photobacterium angustum TaxID=661 RepID=A0A855SI28_PHOAN|nr:catabolite repressor/activator [Photobacterium angustum]KJF82409.1 transcriptional regulator [Photobacterium damselae subsp. damselae]KJG41787.1 transcriptional regulator [Photobacterium angustum]KJG46393.1 transcriptional regulator [Photobacterium angustum]KJG50531.1 transcriptional regulator [Photobacterium angustum]KJG54401.1 transcriptional regulator [Photobacterium angustum]